MKKIGVFLFFIGICLVFIGTQDTEFSFEQQNKTVVEIQVVNKNGKKGRATGFIIDASKGHIATAAHVIMPESIIFVELYDGRKIVAKLETKSDKKDFAIVKTLMPIESYPSIKLAQKIEIGEPVFSIGNPLFFTRIITSGVISGTYHIPMEKSVVPKIISSVPIHQGNSGGPLFNKRGELVGMALAIFNASKDVENKPIASSINIFSDSLEIKKLYERFLNNKSLEQKVNIIIPGDDVIKLVEFEVVVEGYSMVQDVPSFGLLKHDIIVMFNDINIKNSNDIYKIYDVFYDEELNITVLRNGALVHIKR